MGERAHGARLVTAAAWGARLVLAGCQLLVLREVGALGVEPLGLFIVMLSFAPWLLLADAGLGQVVHNRIAATQPGAGPDPTVRASMIATVAGMPILALAWVAIVPLLGPAIAPDHPGALLIAGLLLIPAGVGTVAWRAMYARGSGWIAATWTAAASVAGLAAAGAVVRMGGGLEAALAGWLAPPAATALAAIGWEWRRLSPRFADAVRIPAALREGGGVLLFQCLATATLSLDVLILQAVADAEQVALYGSLQRCLGFASGLHLAAMAAVAPALVRAHAAGDAAGLAGILRGRWLLGALLAAAVAAVLLAFGGSVVRIITGHPLPAGPQVFAIAAALLLVRVWVDTHAAALLAMGRSGILTAMVAGQSIVSVGAMLLLAPAFGAAGVLLALLLSFLLVPAWLLPAAVRRSCPRSAST